MVFVCGKAWFEIPKPRESRTITNYWCTKKGQGLINMFDKHFTKMANYKQNRKYAGKIKPRSPCFPLLRFFILSGYSFCSFRIMDLLLLNLAVDIDIWLLSVNTLTFFFFFLLGKNNNNSNPFTVKSKLQYRTYHVLCWYDGKKCHVKKLYTIWIWSQLFIAKKWQYNNNKSVLKR